MIDDRKLQDDGELTTADLAERRPQEEAEQARQQHPSDPMQDKAEPQRAEVEPPETESAAPLFPGDEAERLKSRWNDIQAGFVDEPRQAVEQADALVASAIKRLAETFADERSRLEAQWDRGDNVETEDLRQALRRYRSFFDRLLSV